MKINKTNTGREKIKDNQGWFIFGVILFGLSLSYLIINYDYLNSLKNLESAMKGIPLTVCIFSGAWMMSKGIN